MAASGPVSGLGLLNKNAGGCRPGTVLTATQLVSGKNTVRASDGRWRVEATRCSPALRPISRLHGRPEPSKELASTPRFRPAASPSPPPAEDPVEVPVEKKPPSEPLVGPTAETSPLVRFAWYASEAFGKAAAVVRGKGGSDTSAASAAGQEARPLSREEAMQMLREDYDQSYFVTGAMTMDLYEQDCEFADPFVSFRGRDRFKQNVSNLGSFMEEVSLKVLNWEVSEEKVTTKWRFSCVLALPWRPILAASGGTDHFFDSVSGRIVKHVERWDISPADGLKQLIKPNPKLKKRVDG